MFNKGTLGGIITVLLAMVIVGVGLTTAVHGFSGSGLSSSDAGPQFERDGAPPPGDFGSQPEGGERPERGSFSLARGLGGVLGNSVILSVIVLVALLIEWLFNRIFSRANGPVTAPQLRQAARPPDNMPAK